MSKEQFLKELRVNLRTMSVAEINDIVKYYEDYFYDAGPENEQKVIEELKSPEALARQLLAEAGYPNGFEIKIMLYSGYNKSTETCEMVVAMLDEVGIKATIEVVDNATFNASMGNRKYPGDNFPWAMFFMGYGAGTADCDEGLRRIWTTSPDGNNNNNYGWYSNATVDKLLSDAKAELDTEKRLELYRQAEQILFIDDPAAIFMNDRFTIWVSSD